MYATLFGGSKDLARIKGFFFWKTWKALIVKETRITVDKKLDMIFPLNTSAKKNWLLYFALDKYNLL